jgi:threonine/homoserine/homoserine lactone efflux protein
MLLVQRRPRLHDGAPRRPAHRPAEVALAVVSRAVLVVAIALGGSVAMLLLLLLLTVASPLGAFLLLWIAWRSDRDARSALERLRARWGRSARIVVGGLS